MNQAATDAKPRKRHDFRHPKDGLYAAKQRPGFQPKKSGKILEKNTKHMSVKLELLIPLIVVGFVVLSMAAFLAELLESGLGAQRIPDWIELKKGRRDGRWAIKPATIRHL